MTQFVLNSSNISENSWVWNFLCQDLKEGCRYWNKNTTYSYKNTEFKFAEDIFARKRKQQNSMVFEMLSNAELGSGAFGSVYPISLTISNGKNGFQARNKSRVVKIQHSQHAIREYQASRSVKHLHVKSPNTDGYMVMKNLGAMTLHSFLKKYRLTNYQRLDLTKALLKAYKEQVIESGLIHWDLHRHTANFLVKRVSDQSPQYEVNIIDYAFAEKARYKSEQSREFSKAIAPIITHLWWGVSKPKEISNLLNNHRVRNISEYIQVFEAPFLAPLSTDQKSVDKLRVFFDELASSDKELASSLKLKILESFKTENIKKINDTIRECRSILQQNKVDVSNFPIVNFGNDEICNRIENCYEQLKAKAEKLKLTEEYKQEGEDLANALKILRENTSDAIYSNENRNEKIKECQANCIKLCKDFKKILEIHRNYNYIFAEIVAVFSSLIILYPIFFGIHYYRTGKLGFFIEANSVLVGEELENDIQQLNIQTRGHS